MSGNWVSTTASASLLEYHPMVPPRPVNKPTPRRSGRNSVNEAAGGAFGTAAPHVKAYFDYWEQFTTGHREQLTKAMEETQASRWRTWAKAAHLVFPPDCFPPAESMLADAARAAGDDREAVARVAFLKLGLTHAKLCAHVAGQISLANPAGSKADAKGALDELIAFRRKTEKSGIGNFNHLAWMEYLSWRLSDEAKKAPELYP